MYKLLFSLMISVLLVNNSYAAADNISRHEKNIIKIKRNLLKIQGEIDEKRNKLDSHKLDVKSLSNIVNDLKEEKKAAQGAYLRIQATDAELVDIDLSEKVAEVQNRFNKVNKEYLTERKKLQKLTSVQNNIERDINKDEIKKKSVNTSLTKAVNNLIAVKLNKQIKKIQTPHTYKARGEAGCGANESLSKCKARAKHEAERKITEKGSVIDIKTVTEINNFELTKDEIRNEVQAKLSNIKVNKKGFLGENGFYFIISATVTPTINNKLKSTLRRSIASDIDAFVKSISSGTGTATAGPTPVRTYQDPELKAAEKRAIIAEQKERELQAKIKAEQLRKQLEDDKKADAESRRSNIIKEQQEKAAQTKEQDTKPKRRVFGGW